MTLLFFCQKVQAMASEGFDKIAAQSLADSLNLFGQSVDHNSTANSNIFTKSRHVIT